MIYHTKQRKEQKYKPVSDSAEMVLVTQKKPQGMMECIWGVNGKSKWNHMDT